MLRAAGARGRLTDVPGRQAQGLDHQSLLPPLGNAIQDPALEKQYGETIGFYLYFFCARICEWVGSVCMCECV